MIMIFLPPAGCCFTHGLREVLPIVRKCAMGLGNIYRTIAIDESVAGRRRDEADLAFVQYERRGTDPA
jgi:hypothetical protein